MQKFSFVMEFIDSKLQTIKMLLAIEIISATK